MKNSIFNAVCKTRYLALLVVLIFTCGNVWGAKITYSFSSKSWAASPANWERGKDGNSFQSGQGIQVTTGVTGANGTSPVSFTAISKIEVTYCTNASKGAGTIKVKVGSNTEKTFSVTKPSSGGTTLKTATFTYSTTETGTVKITVDCSANSVYIYSITIYYQTAVTLNKNGGTSDGSVKINHDATGYVSSTFSAATYDASHTCTGYYTSGGTKILNDDGTFAGSSVTESTTTYISSGKWAYEGGTLTLYAHWQAAASCSTKPALNGAANNGSVSSSSIPVKCTGITSIGDNCSLTSYGFVWAPTATTTTPTLSNSSHQVGTSIATSTEFNYTITGLNANTSYTIRSYATNGYDTEYGSAYTVTTLAACTAAPTVGAGSSSNVTKNTATVTCSAGITSLGTGGCAIESYGFVYGTSQNPTTSNNKVEVGTTYTTIETSFNANLTGLAEGQTYYVRPYATNGSGTAYGTQTSFGTPKITVNPSTQMLKFGGRKVGGSYTMTFTVSGVNLQGNITLTPSSGCTGLFSIDKNSITPDGSGSVTNEVITVTYTPTTAGSHGNVNTIYINITSTNATTKNMAPSGIGQWEVTWTANGVSDTTLVSDNTKPTFPSTPSSCDATSTTFIGWTKTPWTGKQPQSYIDGLTGDDVVHTSNSTMSNVIANGTEYHAVFAKQAGSAAVDVTDELTRATTGVEDQTGGSVSYESWSGKTATSDAVYAGLSAGNNNCIQLRTKNSNEGLVSTASGGKVTRVTVDYDGHTGDGRSIQVYGKNSAYSSAADLFSATASVQGTLLGSIAYVSSSPTGKYLDISGDYTYIGIRSSDGALFASKIYIKWSSGGGYTYSDYLTTCCENKVTLSAGSPSNGTVVFSPTGPIATCSSTASDRQTIVTVTPNAGYKLTGWTKAVSGIALPDSTSAISTSSGNTAAQSNTYTFAQNANGSMTVTATFTANEVTGWTWKQQSEGSTEITIPAVVDLYVGQQAWFNLKSYTPDVIDAKKGYNASYSTTYLAQDNKAGTYYRTRAKEPTESTTLTFTSTSNSSVTQVITIRITALPYATFTDIIHGETFGNVTATVDATDKRIVTTTLKTPTHSDLSDPGSGNECERNHLHLAGWILKDWADEHPDATSSDISGAGAGNFYAPDADIDLVAKNGKTFYAVWAIIE